MKEFHDIARHDFVAWRSAGKPRFGEVCLSMNQSRSRFKSALKYCQQNENTMRADTLARSMMSNGMTPFWKDEQRDINSNVPIATKVDGCVGDTKVMWKCHYKNLFNSVKTGNFKTPVKLDVNQQITISVTITPFIVLDAPCQLGPRYMYEGQLTRMAEPIPLPVMQCNAVQCSAVQCNAMLQHII